MITLESVLPDEVLNPISWKDQAECRGAEADVFFPAVLPGRARKMGYARVDEAKAICARCAVIDLCLLWALKMGEEKGIWGGLTPWERGVQEDE